MWVAAQTDIRTFHHTCFDDANAKCKLVVTTKATPFKFRRLPEKHQDTRGHSADTVRDREAPGSNPGPPTSP
jgi:hypothetical protein